MVPYCFNNGKKTIFDLATLLSRSGSKMSVCGLTCWLQYSRAGCLPCMFPFQLIQGVAFDSSGNGESIETRPPTLKKSHYLSLVRFLCFIGECGLSFIKQASGKNLVANIQCNYLE